MNIAIPSVLFIICICCIAYSFTMDITQLEEIICWIFVGVCSGALGLIYVIVLLFWFYFDEGF